MNVNTESNRESPGDTETTQESEVPSEDDMKYFQKKEKLRDQIEEIRHIIQEMIRENESVPLIERLELKEFNVDDEKQRRHDTMMEQEVARVRDEIQMQILERCYLWDVLKRDCWDSLKVKDRAVKAFHTEHEVTNYALKERPQKELDDLKKVESERKMEVNAASREKTQKVNEQQAGDISEVMSGVVSSYSAELELSHPYLYDQFSLQTTEQKMNQIVLLQDVIYRIKTALNTKFDAVYKQKVQEIARVKERNKQVKELMEELEVVEDLWEPSLNDREMPERVFIVDHTEIKAEKYLTPEQQEEEEMKRLEQQKHLAAKKDNVRGRALDDMMDGVLEVKKDSILKSEVSQPEFILAKANNQWSEEEKKLVKEYEKKVKELNTEKDKYRKSLENEIRGLQKATKDATERFDDSLRKLFERKIKSDMAICQEELKIKVLSYSMLMEEVMGIEEKELQLKLGQMLANKRKMGEELQSFERDLELFQEKYDNIVTEDKALDKDFRKEFSSLHKAMVDQLYKLFKRRPRGPKKHAMEELDAPRNMPEGLSATVWEKFCQVRKTKIDSEHNVKAKASSLAAMQATLHQKQDEDQFAEQEIEHLTELLENLREEKKHFLKDIMVQFLLKQGQVEVTNTDLIPDYSDSILLHRTVVEDLNQTIRSLGEQKIAMLVQTKDFRKGIIQVEWDNTMRRMQIEDLKNKERDIQMLRLTEDHKEYLKTDSDSRVCKQALSMKETLALQQKTYLKDVKHRKQTIRHLHAQAARKEQKNATLDKQIQDLHVTVSQMRHICEASAMEANEAVNTEQRYQEVLLLRKLKDTARIQTEKLAFLSAEAQRLGMRNYPSLVQLKYD
ncbi:cilia- and flagella-associated protein 43 [Dunckerocampus dactyliophorus]|uniref:cilia- and flagella-associated protein 43 n=1 Tax=Dunckerocampus dactyliophorus TaxID=161453 RepID=UPI002405C438|nr:cilia- and flagella-associated protein 43 [Dunckerocampus dactyliophorus]XP_054654463.1 cilia- and flagella-associated protein 43 [Dunckerocampus dactyliophorus]XP_054654464.1 cilia- and flagella-associated protein 43 [Dunckerocampus dactyliophorus]XP_054654465.1 cilia- and flagella-associated protein 43 [Dunckerocampus dactyliophorus]